MPSLVNGLGGQAGFGEISVPRNDDGSSPRIDISSVFGEAGLNFFGTHYSSLFVNTNGNITFTQALGSFIPSPIGTNLTFPIIAGFWMDLDTRAGPQVAPSPGGTSTGSNLIYYDLDVAHHTFTATWDDVGQYSFRSGQPDAFQIQLIGLGDGDFDIVFTYEAINAANSDTNVGANAAARAGYSSGHGADGERVAISLELAGSGTTSAMLDLDVTPGNTGQAGVYLFHVRNGVVIDPGAPPPAPPPILRPVSFSVEAPASQNEGNSGITPYAVTIHRSGQDLSGGSSLGYHIAIADAADLAPGQALDGSIEFAPGQTVATVVVGVVGDRIFESDEYFSFQVTAATHGGETWDPGLSSFSQIINDDPRTSFAFAGPVARPEGLIGPTPLEFMVMRTGDLTGSSTVAWQLDLNGRANAQDFAANQALTGVVTFAPGASQAVIEIRALGDSRVEPDETFTLRLTATTEGTTTSPLSNVFTTGTILDDDARQTLLVATPGTLVLPEGDAGATAFNFSLMRVGDISGAVDVPYAISLAGAGATSAAEILTPLSGLVRFAAGASVGFLTVSVAGDMTPEDNESFLVTLGGGDLNTQYVSGVIMNDDKVVGAGAPVPPPAFLPDGDVSSFFQQLTGGGLWSDGMAV